MALFVNYARELRNPVHLLETCGVGIPTKSGEEQEFLRRLYRVPTEKLRPLLIFAGGFTDNVSALLYRIVQHFPVDVAAQCDIFYREHDEITAMQDLVSFYGMRARPILLIGHSWGASSLVWNVVDKTPFPIDFLATLDPVDWRSRPSAMPQIKRWINVYVDFQQASWHVDNIVARVGRPWEKLDAATENFVHQGARHSSAEPMYVHHVWKPLRERLAELRADHSGPTW